jgi:hypothetical protein
MVPWLTEYDIISSHNTAVLLTPPPSHSNLTLPPAAIMSSFTAPPQPPAPSALTKDLIAHGASIGVDVEKLRNKYLSQKLAQHLVDGHDDEEKLNLKTKMEDAKRMQQLDKDAEARYGVGQSGVPTTTTTTTKEEKGKMEDANSRLDRLKICPRCGGQG